MEKDHKFYNDDKTLKDPGVQLGLQLIVAYQGILKDLTGKSDSIDNEEKKLCEAKVQMEMDMPSTTVMLTLRCVFPMVRWVDI